VTCNCHILSHSHYRIAVTGVNVVTRLSLYTTGVTGSLSRTTLSMPISQSTMDFDLYTMYALLN